VRACGIAIASSTAYPCCPTHRIERMVNIEIQGKVYPATAPYLVGREKVREFARSVASTSALHHDIAAARAAGYSDLVAPPTFAIVVQDSTLQQLLGDEAAAVDFSRVVHGDQRFSYTRPIVAGDELTGIMTIASVKQLGGNSMVTSSTEITDASGAHVVTALSTLVVRAAAEGDQE
jgi:acyl dehydratase